METTDKTIADAAKKLKDISSSSMFEYNELWYMALPACFASINFYYIFGKVTLKAFWYLWSHGVIVIPVSDYLSA